MWIESVLIKAIFAHRAKNVSLAQRWFLLILHRFVPVRRDRQIESIQGLLVREGSEQRVYAVTLTPQRSDVIHERWPRIIWAMQTEYFRREIVAVNN